MLPKDFTDMVGVIVKTLQRWDREGTLKAFRTPTDRRHYTYYQYLQFMELALKEDDAREVVIYARVSTRNQKEGLSPQEELVEDIVSILHVFSCILYGLCKYKKTDQGGQHKIH